MFRLFRRLKVGLPCDRNKIPSKDWRIDSPTAPLTWRASRQRHSFYYNQWCPERVCYQWGHLVYHRNMCIIHCDCIWFVSAYVFVIAKIDSLAASGFTLTSSKGKCAVMSNVLTCASTVSTATVFTVCCASISYSLDSIYHSFTLILICFVFQTVDGYVAYNGSPNWYANGVPSGTTQAPLSVTKLSTSLTIAFVAS